MIQIAFPARVFGTLTRLIPVMSALSCVGNPSPPAHATTPPQNQISYQSVFEKNFEDRMKDLIDKYHPDLYYTDGGPPFKKAGYNVVAHLYNENQKWNGGKLQAVATFKGAGIGIENYEFEYAGTIKPFVWQTDKTMGIDWYWIRNGARSYRKGNEVIHTLIDVASKNGNLLLNVPLTPDGELEQ